MSLTRECLIVEYSADDKVNAYTVTIRELLDKIDEAIRNDELPKITVYEIGDCLLDWS